jgi:membrane protein DedA with SNARE-associated domain
VTIDAVNLFLDVYGLTAIFLVMLGKSIGLPIPIPADALMLTASARVASGRFPLMYTFIALLAALVVGGLVQFLIVRGPARGLIYRYGRYMGLTEKRLDSASTKLGRGNPLTIGLAVLTPGIRSITVVGCGIANVPTKRFVAGLVLGNAAFLALHFLIGFVGGFVLNAIGTQISTGALVAGIAILLVGGVGVWYVIRRRRIPQATSAETLAAAAGAWHEATCPVCLALGATERLDISQWHDHDHAMQAMR